MFGLVRDADISEATLRFVRLSLPLLVSECEVKQNGQVNAMHSFVFFLKLLPLWIGGGPLFSDEFRSTTARVNYAKVISCVKRIPRDQRSSRGGGEIP